MANFIPNLDKIRDGANFIARYVLAAFRAIEAKFPVGKFDIESVFGYVIDWTGAPVLPPGIIPWDAAPVASGTQIINCIDILRNMVVQYRGDDELYFGPGHVLHRGLFKTQTCNDDGTWVSANAASLVIPDECPVGPGTTSGLEADTWYYVYAKLDAAGEGPEYRISKTPPDICEGKGPEHPSYPKLRFLGSFRTMAAPYAFIRPFHRYANGWVFWTNIAVGPEAPDFNLITSDTAGYITASEVEDWVPQSADFVVLTYDVRGGTTSSTIPSIRTKGDTATVSGYTWDEATETATAGLPVGTLDPTTDMPRTEMVIERDTPDNDDFLAVSGYHEALL